MSSSTDSIIVSLSLGLIVGSFIGILILLGRIANALNVLAGIQ